MIQSRTIDNVTSTVLSPYLERINDHNLNNTFEKNSILYIGRISDSFAVYRYPSSDNFPTYSIAVPEGIYQDTWYEKGDNLALYLLKAPFALDSRLLSTIQTELLNIWKSTDSTEFFIKALKSDSFMNMPIPRSRWSLFCWCNGNLLVICFEPETGIISLDCANTGEEWNNDTLGSFNTIFTILEGVLNLE